MALLRESKNPSQVARSPISASDWISGLGLKRTLMAQNDPYYGKLFPSPAAAFAQASRLCRRAGEDAPVNHSGVETKPGV